jgi:ubiquinone/menaquinone biosynthesis C-methylase UbiE
MAIDVRSAQDQQRAIWDDVSVGWQRWREQFERGARTVTAKLLRDAAVAPGQSVLDIGSGVGEPALSAARIVGPAGRVVGIDLSPAMVVAARSATSGLANVEFRAADVESLDLPEASFDGALSRWSLMFAADRVRALRVVARLLVPGGVLAAAVWSRPQDVPTISLAFRVIAERLELGPPPPGPGPFTMCEPDAVRAELDEAGFDEVEIDEVVVPFRFASVNEFVRFARDVLPPGMKRQLRERCGSVDDPGVWGGVEQAARSYQTAGGAISLPSVSLCIRAVAGGARAV